MGYRQGVGPVNPSSYTRENVQGLQYQKEALEAEIKILQDTLKNIEQRLSEIEKKE
jgi:chaperonin cofactor prefoldin